MKGDFDLKAEMEYDTILCLIMVRLKKPQHILR